MIDPLTSLGFLLHSNPGVYAILLGSGVSRSAHIPTGWEIILDLCRKLAMLEGDDAGTDPAAWYVKKHGGEPNYSELLHAIAKTPTERQQLLRTYFEPTEEQRENGEKQPTEAHRAVARLMANGYVKVVLTTNFDRLLERSVEDEGIAPTVVSTPDAIAGALPLAHQKCLIVKLHGDFLDARIRNTEAELANYEPAMREFLDRVLDEFGLIVCGWSAQWDSALRNAMAGARSRRFGMFWARRGKPQPEATQLITHRGATEIPIESADSFFKKLSDSVLSLEESQRPHPQTVQAAIALTKRYLSDQRHQISLHDLLVESTDRAIEAIAQVGLEVLDRKGPIDYQRALLGYRESLEVLQAMLVQSFPWATDPQTQLLVECIGRVAETCPTRSNLTPPRCLWQYPAVFLLYSGGIAALAKERFSAIVQLLHRARRSTGIDGGTVVRTTEWPDLHQMAEHMAPQSNQHVPFSEHLFFVLRPGLRSIIPSDSKYEDCFDRFEYLRSLVFTDEELQAEEKWEPWTPPGRFAYKRGNKSVDEPIRREIEKMQSHWPLLAAGLFEGSLDRLQKAQKHVSSIVGRFGYY